MKEQIKNWKSFFHKEDSSVAPSAVAYPRAAVNNQTSTQADGVKGEDRVKTTTIPKSQEQLDRDYTFNPQLDKDKDTIVPDVASDTDKKLDNGRDSTK